MSRRRIRVGDRVAIVGMTIGGRLVVEGHATVVTAPADAESKARVRFDGSREVLERWVDPGAQGSPHAYVDGINAALGFSKVAP